MILLALLWPGGRHQTKIIFEEKSPTTRWSIPSSMKMSVAHICHGHDGVGVGVRGAAAFWLWKWLQASHWWTTSLMALFMLGQKKLPRASNCEFVIP